MKVLIVSFDKTLTDSLKEVLKDHEVYTSKNSEEALKVIPSDVEGIIYDAISGAISEEDINTLYTKKFSNARYVILYDELFPIDENNIIVPIKVLVPRDENPEEVVKKLVEFSEESGAGVATEAQEPPPAPQESVEVQDTGDIEIEPTTFQEAGDIDITSEQEIEIEPATQSVEEALEELGGAGTGDIEIEPTDMPAQEDIEPEDIPQVEVSGGDIPLEDIESSSVTEEIPQMEEIPQTEEIPVAEESPVVEEPPQVEEPAPAPAATSEGGKILIVSFDQALIDSLKATFGQRFDVVNVKTVKQAIDKGKDASLVVFDAISGVIAEKGLIEMSNDSDMAGKTYLILVDDLFPINVDNIPLPNKEAVSRDTDPSRLKEMIEEMLSRLPAQTAQEAEPAVEEEPQAEIEQTLPEEVQLEESVQEELPADIEEPTYDIAGEVENVEEVVESLPSADIEEPVPSQEAEIPPTPPEQPAEEEEIPALEALEKIIEEKGLIEEEHEEEHEEEEPVAETTAPAQAQNVNVSLSNIDIESLVEKAVEKALSQDRIKEAVTRALEDQMAEIRDVVADLVRIEVEKLFEELDVRNLIRHSAYQAMKDRLEELIT